jgi:hypothetical protein
MNIGKHTQADQGQMCKQSQCRQYEIILKHKYRWRKQLLYPFQYNNNNKAFNLK